MLLKFSYPFSTRHYFHEFPLLADVNLNSIVHLNPKASQTTQMIAAHALLNFRVGLQQFLTEEGKQRSSAYEILWRSQPIVQIAQPQLRKRQRKRL